MTATHCDYKIRSIKDEGNQVTVEWAIYEGSYQDVIEEGETVNRYVRSGIIQTGTDWFEKSPVLNNEIETALKEAIQEYKGDLEVIAECL
ncbi:MAG: hypothetical protein PHX51_07210 [Clostridia bacterium]|nr:hypothetical protein [Clostridia bacterium]